MMATKSKRVTYKDPADDNADYLEPLQYNPKLLLPSRTDSPDDPTPPGGLFGSIYFPISLLLYVGVPISQLVIGLIYIGQCTVRQFISPYMILSGIFGIAFVIVGLVIYMQIQKQASSDDRQSKSKSIKILIPIFVLLFLFVISWWIAAHVIVLEVKLRVELFDPVLPEYCHGNLYKPAYIFIFVDYLILLIGIILNVLSCMSPPKVADKKKPKRPVRRARK